jgi:hypothetical protein
MIFEIDTCSRVHYGHCVNTMKSWFSDAVSMVTSATTTTPPPTTTTSDVVTNTPTPDVAADGGGGSMFSSVFDSVAGVVKKTVAQISETVNNATTEGQTATASPPPPPPWTLSGPTMEAKELVLKNQILNLSQEKWTFMQSPQEVSLVGFEFQIDAFAPLAQECLRLDPQLEKMRWLLVPWKVKVLLCRCCCCSFILCVIIEFFKKEEPFWRNYFAHVHAVKNAVLHSALDGAALARAGVADHESHRVSSITATGTTNTTTGTTEEISIPTSPIEMDKVLGSLDDEIGDGDDGGTIIELSSMDGMSLEDQINAALEDD